MKLQTCTETLFKEFCTLLIWFLSALDMTLHILFVLALGITYTFMLKAIERKILQFKKKLKPRFKKNLNAIIWCLC